MKKEVTKSPKKAEAKKDAATTKAVAAKAGEKERKTKTKEKNYIYRFQVEEKGISDKEQKKRRNKLRRAMQNLVNAIIIAKGDAKKEIQEFVSFYKKNYILNDFSMESITNSPAEDKQEDFTRVLDKVKKSLEK